MMKTLKKRKGYRLKQVRALGYVGPEGVGD